VTKLLFIGRPHGVPLYVHWSVVAIGGVLLLGAIERPIETAVALLAYMGVLLVHEAGHAYVARRKRCAVYRIELFPIHGLTHFSQPSSPFDHCTIVWGGVLAQWVVAAPLIAWTWLFGFTSIGAVNAVLALLGYYSLLTSLVNLLPIPRLDGATAWYIVPLLWSRWRSSRRALVVTERRTPTKWVH
jgi:Zn-dependent protease